MKFWIIQAQENPAAPRQDVSRREWRSNTLAETLADRGHDVVRWRSSFSHQEKQQLVAGSVCEPKDNYIHQFIDSPAYKRHIGFKRIFNHHVLGKNFSKIADIKTELPDVIQVGNVPIELSHAAVAFGKKKGIPVVIDVRDLWPDIYVDFIPRKLSLLRRPILWMLNLFGIKVKRAFSNATAITGLTQSYLNWGLEKGQRKQREQDAIFPMCYPQRSTPPVEATIMSLRKQIGVKEEDIIAVYAGNIGYQSDFTTLLEAAQILEDKQPNFKLVVAGSGPREAELKAMAFQMKNVIFAGWLNSQELHALLSISTFGLVAYNSVPNFLRNIPNKFSEYLAEGLVICCALEGEMGRLTRSSGCGFVYSSGDARELARNIEDSIHYPDNIKKMSENAKNLHAAEFDGALIYPKFADYLEQLATSSNR